MLNDFNYFTKLIKVKNFLGNLLMGQNDIENHKNYYSSNKIYKYYEEGSYEEEKIESMSKILLNENINIQYYYARTLLFDDNNKDLLKNYNKFDIENK